ncbi:MAG: phosphohydrolase [Fusobacteria bacterium]|nr:MAG: phosphohydrolase [Fusobacteriota bacterium]
MKKFDFFGRRLTIGLEKKETNEKKVRNTSVSKKEIVRERMWYLIIVMIMIISSTGFDYVFNESVKENSVATKDIIAPSEIIYNDKEAKEKIINEIIKNASKNYIEINDVEDGVIGKVEEFFKLLKTNHKVTIEDIKEIDKNLDDEELRILLKDLSTKSNEELDELEKKYTEDIKTLYHYGIRKEDKLVRIDDALKKVEIDSVEETFIRLFVKPNYIYDKDQTVKQLEEKIKQVKDVSIVITAGSTIIKKGEIVTAKKINILKHAGLYGNVNKAKKFTGMFFYLIMLSILFKSICVKFIPDEIENKSYYKAIFLSVALGLLVFRFVNPSFRHMIPIETIFILLGILINVRTTLIMGGFLILYSIPLTGYNMEYLVIETLSLMGSLYLITKIKNRTDIINTGIYLGMGKAVLLLIIAIALNFEFIESVLKGGSLLLSGVFTGMLTIAFLPYFENTFNILTNIKLLELGDLSQPLLRKLSVTAPGTFHHSMMVATLSEQATEAIGGNHIFARVASYYHDIGKMKRPQFYVENQADGINLHNNLTPSMSTLIITSHTKDGDELGKEYNIPKEIRDIMYEHQGTTLLAYFYNKAKQTDPHLDENNFRYSGPKPRSKESAVIMLADSIEAAVRSLDEKTPITIERMLRKIINSKIEEEQLSDADLTFKEIEIIIKTFTKALMSIHHVRIKYPGQK